MDLPQNQGRITLAERALGDDPRRRDAVSEVLEEIQRSGLHSVRLAFADQHGMLRGKTLRSDLVVNAMEDGLGITSALLLKDTGQNNVYPVWGRGAGLGQSAMTGAGDVVMLPDPTTFRELPWVDGTGWLMCDLFTPRAEPIIFSTRQIAAAAQAQVEQLGYGFRAGLEIEFHLFKLDDRGMGVADTREAVERWDLSHTHLGRVYLGEQRFDQIEPFLELLRRDLTALGLVPRTMEIELGPSQVELTFSPGSGLEVADQAVLLRSAVKQISHRHGLHATFMSRPNIGNSFTSGWHLHQSLVDPGTGHNALVPASEVQMLSDVGGHFVAGLLKHASESCLLTTPTVTGYKRYRPDSLAPDRVAWGRQHRGAMLRVVGGPDDPATRVENRVGDSAANPYLFLASQMLSGAAGLRAGEAPAHPTESPYEEAAGPRLPRSLAEAIECFDGSALYRGALGDEFVDYLVTLKRAEWNRFMSSVTDWEHREYFDLF